MFFLSKIYAEIYIPGVNAGQIWTKVWVSFDQVGKSFYITLIRRVLKRNNSNLHQKLFPFFLNLSVSF